MHENHTGKVRWKKEMKKKIKGGKSKIKDKRKKIKDKREIGDGRLEIGDWKMKNEKFSIDKRLDFKPNAVLSTAGRNLPSKTVTTFQLFFIHELNELNELNLPEAS